jgi:hypothetical protein
MTMIVTLENVKDEMCKVKIKPEIGSSYYKEFNKKSLQDYVEKAKSYCEIKGYEFIYKDLSRKEKTRGGKREGAGRPALGTTKKVSITLPDDIWEKINDTKEAWGVSQSQVLRAIVNGYFNQENDEN